LLSWFWVIASRYHPVLTQYKQELWSRIKSDRALKIANLVNQIRVFECLIVLNARSDLLFILGAGWFHWLELRWSFQVVSCSQYSSYIRYQRCRKKVWTRQNIDKSRKQPRFSGIHFLIFAYWIEIVFVKVWDIFKLIITLFSTKEIYLIFIWIFDEFYFVIHVLVYFFSYFYVHSAMWIRQFWFAFVNILYVSINVMTNEYL
jgi:hypothetical protein